MGDKTWSRIAFVLLEMVFISVGLTIEAIAPKSIKTVQVQPLWPFAPSKGGDNSRFSLAKVGNVKCPRGMVPILRTYNSSTSIRPFGEISGFRGDPIYNRRGYVAAFATRTSTFYCSQSAISVWQPDIAAGKPPRFSGAIATMHSGEFPNLSGLYAGWFVDRHLYGDDHVHFEVGWTENGTSCINLLCAGFVQISTKICLGDIIKPISTINGSNIVIRHTIYKDPQDGNWGFLSSNEFIGYWPNELLSRMSESGSIVGWVGVAAAARGEPFPPMGSGRSPDEGLGRAAYFSHAKIVGVSNKLEVPDLTQVFSQETDHGCYQVGHPGNPDQGMNFFFAGGGCSPR